MEWYAIAGLILLWLFCITHKQNNLERRISNARGDINYLYSGKATVDMVKDLQDYIERNCPPCPECGKSGLDCHNYQG